MKNHFKLYGQNLSYAIFMKDRMKESKEMDIYQKFKNLSQELQQLREENERLKGQTQFDYEKLLTQKTERIKELEEGIKDAGNKIAMDHKFPALDILQSLLTKDTKKDG